MSDVKAMTTTPDLTGRIETLFDQASERERLLDRISGAACRLGNRPSDEDGPNPIGSPEFDQNHYGKLSELEHMGRDELRHLQRIADHLDGLI